MTEALRETACWHAAPSMAIARQRSAVCMDGDSYQIS
jgi:hypothetical protein